MRCGLSTVAHRRPPEIEPPRLQTPLPGWRLVPPLLLLGALGSINLAAFLTNLAVAWPACGMRLLTGLPCPLCGATRCLASVARLEFAPAFVLNPLVFLAVCAAFVWFLFWLAVPRFRVPTRTSRILGVSFSFRFWLILLTLNWVFLCLSLP
ncbi:MAG: DUF2752 domain-containing protein [Verrucomicrobia bacterium]|nr:DUF2752 domain-containing protein [Verrucomicrobiota bacterium]